jgi:spermidine synthase
MAELGFLREEACSSDIVSLYPISRYLWQAKTAFADAVIAEVPALGTCLFLDNEIQSSSSDEDIYHECLVHPVMASVPSKCRDRVLVVGGGEGATVREVLKWSDVKAVDWVDIDGEVVAACREHLKWGQDAAYTDPRVTYYDEDIHSFLQNTDTKYDVIIIDLPDPDPTDNPLSAKVLMNRPFWCQIRDHLATGGAWVSHSGPVRRSGPSGATFIQRATAMADFYTSDHTEYHAVIPAFQDDWGYVMNCRPHYRAFDFPVRFLTLHAYRYIFQWANASTSTRAENGLN